MDSNKAVTADFALRSPGGPLSFRPDSVLPDGTVGVPYSYSFCKPTPSSTTALCGTFPPTTDPTGGSPPYHFQTEGGFPPFGLSLNLNGLLRGTPSVAGTTTFRVCAVDTAGSSICQPVTIVVVGTTNGTYAGNFTGTTTGTSGSCVWTVTITGRVTATIAGGGTAANPYTGNATATGTATGTFSIDGTPMLDRVITRPLTLTKQ